MSPKPERARRYSNKSFFQKRGGSSLVKIASNWSTRRGKKAYGEEGGGKVIHSKKRRGPRSRSVIRQQGKKESVPKETLK